MTTGVGDVGTVKDAGDVTAVSYLNYVAVVTGVCHVGTGTSAGDVMAV